ncbi:S-adenosyl-L-methionine-dependent methyltransferase [Marasmius fiardii PR-910]|nr:S-adenosyl-L-methionine-dependent methyltransferase [Marasmius fiardii PR-910]
MASSTSSRAQIKALLELINSSAEEAMAEYEKTGHGIPFPGSKGSHPLDSQSGALALKRAIRTLEGACERLCTTLAQPMHTLLSRAMSYESSCLNFVAEEGIADVLEMDTASANQGMHIKEIAARTKNIVSPEKLGPVMLLLATRGCFEEVVSRDVYTNNRISLPLLTSSPINPTISMYSEFVQAASMLPETLVHPKYASTNAVNRTAFSYLVRNEMEDASWFDWLEAHLLQRAMAGLRRVNGSTESIDLIAQTAGSGTDLITFCDVGSGFGEVALALSEFYVNKFRVVLQDLAVPLEHAKSLWSAEHPEADVLFVPMDFMKEPPVPKQDVYYLSLVIHDWPDTDAITILRNIASVMNNTSRVLLHEHVLQHCHPQSDKDSHGYSGIEKAPEPLLPNYGSGSVRAPNLSVAMLALFNSFERASEDFASLGQHAGLKLVKIWPLSETYLIEYMLAESGR